MKTEATATPIIPAAAATAQPMCGLMYLRSRAKAFMSAPCATASTARAARSTGAFLSEPVPHPGKAGLLLARPHPRGAPRPPAASASAVNSSCTSSGATRSPATRLTRATCGTRTRCRASR